MSKIGSFERKLKSKGQKESYKLLRKTLWEKDPHCHWCKAETILPENVFLAGRSTKWTKPPENMATLDHLYSRLNPERHKGHESSEEVVLSCIKCNAERDQLEQEWTKDRENHAREKYLNSEEYKAERKNDLIRSILKR